MHMQLKAYATDQKNLTEWKKSNSHVLDGRIFDEHWWDYEDDVYGIGSLIRLINWVMSFFLTFFFTVFFAVVLFMCAPKRDNTQYHIYHSLLWSSTGILSVWWVIVYTVEIIKVSQWASYSNGLEYNLNFLWLIYILALVILYSLPFIGLNIGRFIIRCCNIHNSSLLVFVQFPDIHILSPSQAAIGGIFCGCRPAQIIKLCFLFCKKLYCCCAAVCCQCSECQCSEDMCACKVKPQCKNIKFCCNVFVELITLCIFQVTPIIIIVVFFCSAGFVIINIVPVILYFLLYPIRVLSFYSFLLAVFVLFTFVLTATDFERKRGKHITGKEFNNSFRSNMYIYLPFCVLCLIALVGVVFVVIYRTIVSGGSTGTTLYNLFKALIPTILISSPAIWLWRNMKEYYLKGIGVDTEKSEEVTDITSPTDNPFETSDSERDSRRQEHIPLLAANRSVNYSQ